MQLTEKDTSAADSRGMVFSYLPSKPGIIPLISSQRSLQTAQLMDKRRYTSQNAQGGGFGQALNIYYSVDVQAVPQPWQF